MSINSLRMTKINNYNKTSRQKTQERKTLEGVLVNNHTEKIKNVDVDDYSKNSQNQKKEENTSSFNTKKALAPLIIGTVATFGAMGAVSAIVKGSTKKILSSAPTECLPDLALNMNIKQEPQFALYRMLRDPNTKNIIGFGAVILFSAMTVVLKSFVDGIKKVWIKNREADIQKDLQKNLIAVETKSFSGKLDVIRNKLNNFSTYFKSITNEDNKNNLGVSFKSNKKTKSNKNDKKQQNLVYGALGLGVVAFSIIMGRLTFKNIKQTTKIANDYTNSYVQKTANLIDELVKKKNKDDLPIIKNLLESIHASDKYISDTLKKFDLSDGEISSFVDEITKNSKSIFADAPTALGGIPKKIQYYCYLDEDRGHLYNWVINSDNKFTKYIFLAFSSLSALGYLGKEIVDAVQNVIVQKEYSNTELDLAKRLVDVEVENFKAKKDSAINPLIEDFKLAYKNGATKEELSSMADNIIFEIKNGPPYVYS